MTQQPYAPQYPQPPYQQPPPQQQPYAPQYPQAPQQPAPYAAPGYPQQYAPQAPPAPAGPPPAQGTLDDFYNQPTAGSGPSISWKNKPDGTWYAGIVARDVINGDVQQQTDPVTKMPKAFNDGRPMWVMKVPLNVEASQEHPNGEATLFVRGQMQTELTRAMAEQGCAGAPKANAGIVVILKSRRPNPNGGNPTNIFEVRYTPAGTEQRIDGAQAPATGAASPAPVAEPQAPQYPQQPAAAPSPSLPPPPPVQQIQQPVPPQAPAAPPPPAPAYAEVPQQPMQQAPAQVQQQPAGAPPAPPEGMPADQAALLAKLTGQAPA